VKYKEYKVRDGYLLSSLYYPPTPPTTPEEICEFLFGDGMMGGLEDFWWKTESTYNPDPYEEGYSKCEYPPPPASPWVDRIGNFRWSAYPYPSWIDLNPTQQCFVSDCAFLPEGEDGGGRLEATFTDYIMTGLPEGGFIPPPLPFLPLIPMLIMLLGGIGARGPERRK